MLEQNIAGLNKKGITEIITIILLVILSIAGVLIIWSVTREIVLKSPSQLTSCIDFFSFSIDKACYLNKDEIKITIKRKFKNINVNKIKFEFYPSNALWEISGEKCLDVRLENKKYGEYCDIVDNLESISYIFKVSDLEIQEKVFVAVEGNEIICEIGEKEIKEVC